MPVELMAVGTALFLMLVFPGFMFLTSFGMFAEWMDRKLYARMQNRMGPPFYQPLADFIKLISKQEITPELADKGMYKYAPVVALASVVTAFFYVPVWGYSGLFSFTGDVIVVLYLLTIPTVTFFIGGWYSRSVYSMLGAVRTLMQMFAYEIPLFLAILGPALLAGTWQLSGLAEFYGKHYPWQAILPNLVGFGVAIVAMLGKLEKVPFDIPEAETEIVAGSFTEYSGRLFGIFRMAISIEMIVGCALIAAVFLPFGLNLGPIVGFVLFVVKVLGIVAVTSLMRTVFARLRIDQMINFCWQVAAPVAFVLLLVDLVIKGWLR
jgi:NADH-quinone oxidoreductase subunit H